MVAEHGLGQIGIYDQPVLGRRMFLMVILRVAFISCVPIFMLLSGYLLSSKRPCREYYKGIWKTLAIYLLASMACILFRANCQKVHFDLRRIIIDILGYAAAPYAWYIEMYMGLFLLAPFLNVMYHSLPSKRHKQALLFTFVFITVLPRLTNIFHFFVKEWWLDPVLTGLYTKILPAWWIDIWPLTFYFWGIYRREYPAARRPLYSFLLYLASVLVGGAFSIYRSYGVEFFDKGWAGYDSSFVFFNTILLFEWLAAVKIPRVPWLTAVLRRLSDLCLGAYLVSYIFDELFYPLLLERVSGAVNRFVYLPLMVLLVGGCSFALSFVLSGIWKLLVLLGRRLKPSRQG